MRSEGWPWHVIAVQDPPPEFAYGVPPTYQCWYSTPRPLTEDDNPNLPRPHTGPRGVGGAQPPRERVEFTVPVGFYVAKSIKPSDWEVVIRGRLVASLSLQTRLGRIEIHNIYNRL